MRVPGQQGMAGFLHAAKAVGDEHVGPGDAGGQGRVGRRVLLMAPLPVDDLARLPVDRYQEAPAVCHIRAVGHERVMDHPVRCDCRLDVPAPADPFTPGPGAHGPHLFLGPARQQPVRNSLNCAARARSCLRAVDAIEQDGHIQRCVPDLLRPCLRIRPWHMGQCLALFDLVLIPQSNRNGHPCKTPINNPTY